MHSFPEVLDHVRHLLDSGRIYEAIGELEELISLNPNFGEAYALRGEAERRLGHWHAAISFLTQAIRLIPRHPYPYASRGDAYAKCNQKRRALADFNRALELDESYAWALFRRGDLHLEASRYDDAIADINRAIEEEPERSELYATRGEALRLSGKHSEAIADFNRAIDENVTSAWIYASRGKSRMLTGDRQEAEVDFTFALRSDPEYGWALAQRGEIYRLSGRYEAAIADLSKSIALDPKNAWALASRGACYRSLGKLSEAWADLSQALAVDANYNWARSNRGALLFDMGKRERALVDLDTAIASDPKHVFALKKRAELLVAERKYQAALDDFGRLLSLASGDAWTIAHRAEALALSGRKAEALAGFDRAIELKPDYAWAYASRAELHLSLGSTESALDDYSTAIDLNYKDRWARKGRATVLGRLGRHAEADADIEYLLALDPRSTSIQMLAGKHFCARGSFERAIRAFQTVPSDDPIYPKARLLEARVVRLAGNPHISLRILNDIEGEFPTLDGIYQERAHANLACTNFTSSVADATVILNQKFSIEALLVRAQGLEMLGRFDDAMQDVIVALEADPNHEFALELQTRLLVRKATPDGNAGDFSEAYMAFITGHVDEALIHCNRSLDRATKRELLMLRALLLCKYQQRSPSRDLFALTTFDNEEIFSLLSELPKEEDARINLYVKVQAKAEKDERLSIRSQLEALLLAASLAHDLHAEEDVSNIVISMNKIAEECAAEGSPQRYHHMLIKLAEAPNTRQQAVDILDPLLAARFELIEFFIATSFEVKTVERNAKEEH